MAFILTKKYVIALGVVAGLAVAGLGVNFAVMPTISNVTLAREEVDAAKLEVDDMQTRLAALQESENNFAFIQGIDEELRQQFPSSVEESLLNEILRVSASQGMGSNQVKSLQFDAPVLVIPSAPAGTTETAPVTPAPTDGATAETGDVAAAETSFGDGFAEVSFQLSLEGSQAQIIGFLQELNKSSRAIVVSQSGMTQEGENYVLSLTGKAYLSRLITPPPAPGEAVAEDTTTTEEVVVEDGSTP